MENFFQTAFKPAGQLTWNDLFFRISMAAVLGFAVMLVYRFSRKGVPRNHSFEITLVLLSILIAMVTNVIGDSVARAFSLVGALSIVRFRTVVRDTQDTAYVIFSVVVGMAAGANFLAVAVIGLLIIVITAALMRRRKTVVAWNNDTECTLNLRVPLGNLLDQLNSTFFPKFLESFQLTSITTGRQGISLEASYNVRLRSTTAPTDLVRELNKVEGVQSVELISPDAIPLK